MEIWAIISIQYVGSELAKLPWKCCNMLICANTTKSWGQRNIIKAGNIQSIYYILIFFTRLGLHITVSSHLLSLFCDFKQNDI